MRHTPLSAKDIARNRKGRAKRSADASIVSTPKAKIAEGSQSLPSALLLTDQTRPDPKNDLESITRAQQSHQTLVSAITSRRVSCHAWKRVRELSPVPVSLGACVRGISLQRGKAKGDPT